MRQARRSVGVLAWVVVGLGVVMLGVPFVSAQTDVLYVVNNKVGIGTATPTWGLHLQLAPNTYDGIVATSSDGSGTGAGALFGAIADWGSLGFQVHGSARTISRYGITLGGWAEINQATGGHGLILATRTSTPLVFATNTTERVRIDATGNVGIGTTAPAYPLQMGSGAYCTVGGVWTSVSSRASKQDIQDLSTEAAEATLEKLNPVTFAYKAAPEEHHVGFIAEDVPDLVATADRKGMSALDVVAVLTKVMQEQQKTITELTARIAELEKRR